MKMGVTFQREVKNHNVGFAREVIKNQLKYF